MLKANAKYVVLSVLVLMLIGAGYINFRYSESNQATDVASVDAGVIADAQATTAASSIPAATQAASEIGQGKDDYTATETPKNTDDQTTAADASTTVTFFSDFRVQRDSVRNQEIAYLNEIITDESSDKDSLKDAQDQKIEITRVMEQEMLVEGMIKAKGFEDAVVTIHNGSVNVVVKEAEISSAQVAQILDIVCRETGESADNIKIIPNG